LSNPFDSEIFKDWHPNDPITKINMHRLVAGINLGCALVLDGYYDFDNWKEQMLIKHGDWFLPYLDFIWNYPVPEMFIGNGLTMKDWAAEWKELREGI